MKNLKKCFALLLVLFITIALVACGGEPEGENDTTTATASSVDGETTVSGTSDKSVKKGKVTSTVKVASVTTQDIAKDPNIKTKPGDPTIKDLIARTTNARGNASDKFVKSLKGFTLKIFYPWENIYATKEGEKAAKASMKAVQDEYGVKIEDSGKFSNYNESLAADLASKNCEYQIYYVQSFNFASWFQKGYLSNLNTAMTESGVDFGDPWYLPAAKGFLSIDGNQYGWIPYEDEYTMPISVIYNKTLLTKKRLADPAMLAKQGKWTWSTLESYAKKFANDKSVTGFFSGAQNLFSVLANRYGTSTCKVSRGTQPNTNIGDPKYKSALTTLSQWCTGKKAWVEDFSGQSWNYPKNQFSQGKVAMYFGGHDDIQALVGTKAGDFGIVPFPTKSGSKTYTSVSGPYFICFIPTQFQKQSSKILFIRNEYYRQNYRFAARNFKYNWERYFKDGDVLEDACNIKYGRNGNSIVFNWLPVCEDNSAKVTTNTVLEYVVSGKGSAATAITKYKSALIASYSDIWKGHITTGKV